MNSSTRSVLLFFGAILLAGVVMFGYVWIQQAEERSHREALRAHRAQFEKLLGLVPRGVQPSRDVLRAMAEAVNAELVFVSDGEVSAAARDHREPELRHVFPGGPGAKPRVIEARFRAAPPLERSTLFSSPASVMGLCILTGLCGIAAGVLFARWFRTDYSEAHAAKSEAELYCLTHLAQLSEKQGTELERERIERTRMQEDLHFQQILFNRALEDRIRLAHDLHDGVIQSLYAAGMSLEASKRVLADNADKAGEFIETAVNSLNQSIRDIRSYIVGLGSDQLRRQGFSDYVRSFVNSLSALKPIALDLKIDDEAAAALEEDQQTELLQMIREAVSNSIRHGEASQVSVRLHRSDAEVCLLVQDDGSGFDPRVSSSGQGQASLQARAKRLNGKLERTTAPGRGVRLVLTLPISTKSSHECLV